MSNDGKFKKGNKLWQLADPFKVGRPSLFPTPEHLWNEAIKYFEFQDKTPIITTENITADKGSSTKNVEHSKPYTWEGLYIFLGVYDLDHYKTKTEFSLILKLLKDIIYNQKFEGATVGIFNSNIIARDLGLKDNSDITTKGESLNALTKEEAIKKANELDNEF